MNENILNQVKVIFEDEFLLAIDKPSGLVVHSDNRTEEKSFIDWLKEYLATEQILEKQKNIGKPHTLDSGRYEDRWGILNRLDRETSGIILIAKDEKTFEELNKNWREKVEKKYVAILHGEVDVEKLSTLPNLSLFKERNRTDGNQNIFKITEPLSRHKKDPRIWVLKSDEGSRVTTREAETLFEILEQTTRSFASQNPSLLSGGESEPETKKFTLVNFWPLTGRTHQLRLHAKFLGNPILGDKKYSFGGIDNVEKIDLENRLMLHAKELTFIHPVSKKIIYLTSMFNFPNIVL
jgi:23S rRNA-/tRNA-specific pseudouridylate synthase